MKSFNDYLMGREYAWLEKLGDELAEIYPLLTGRRFIPHNSWYV